MTNALSVLSRQPRTVLATTAAAAAATGVLAHKWNAAVRSKRLEKGFLRSSEHDHRLRSSSPHPQPTAKVDARFVADILHFLRVCFPSVYSREVGLLFTVSALLAARSWLDLWASSNGGHVVKAIVGRDRAAFLRRAVRDIALMMFPMSFVNNSLRYVVSRLKVAMNRRMSLYLHDKYLSDDTFYKVSNLDSRMRNVDQLLTVDVDRLCVSLADLYCNVSKPVIDIVLFSRRLSRSLGPAGPLSMISYFAACSLVLRAVQPPFGELTATQQRLEGEYRLRHSRLITHSEEIAFFAGGQREKLYINAAFDNLTAHLRSLFAARWRNGFIDSLLVKYVATIVGYLVVSLPIFFSESPISRLFAGLAAPADGSAEATNASDIAGLYTRNSRLLLSLAGAIGRVVMAGKEVTKLTGFTQRVSRLESVLDDLADSRAVRKRFESSPDLQSDLRLAELMTPGKLIVASPDAAPEDSSVQFEGVHLVSPDCTLLAENLTVEIPRGCHVLTTGPNGAGKSSLFRVLAGLWPLYGGTLRRPSRERIFYVPQRPYLALGSLRENVVYPHTWAEAAVNGATDDTLNELLETVHLGDVARRPGGLDAVHDWADVLSGGQKQRLGFARLLFHRPEYAILDEASSAVSIDIEQVLYQAVKDCGVTLISVSHRPSLWGFHDKVLALNGRGGYEFRDIREDDVPSLVSGVSGAAAAAAATAGAAGPSSSSSAAAAEATASIEATASASTKEKTDE